MHPLVDVIQKSQNIVLSTHTQPDGDGLGCQFALFWALKKAGKNARIVNPDPVPRKYQFLDKHSVAESMDKLRAPLKGTDLVLIFDTNDPELLLDLWSQFEGN